MWRPYPFEAFLVPFGARGRVNGDAIVGLEMGSGSGSSTHLAACAGTSESGTFSPAR